MSNEIAPLTLGWTIVYVEDPVAASEFYASTFGLEPEFAAPDGSYAQMDTGQTKLAFASYGLGESNFPGGVSRPEPDRPPNVEVTLVTTDVDGATRVALDAGCTSLAEPVDKPHGQRVAFLRDPFGTLIEIGSPM
jgi:predicted enzyme related to lactoylglutathione lyase